MADTDGRPGAGMQWLGDWLTQAANFWTAVMGPGMAQPSGEKSRLTDAVDATRRIFEASVGPAGADPAMWATFAKTLQMLPAVAGELWQHVLEGYLELGRRWSQQAQKMSRTAAKPFDFADLDKEFIQRWTDIYREAFQRYLHIPQLGLGKFHQEKLQMLMDAHNLFQAASVEFMQMLMVPVEKAIGVMQHQLADMAEKKALPQDPKAYYALWVKTLEGHYMTLFRSPAYTETLARTVEASNRYMTTRRAVMEGWLRMMPAPTMADMDELARDVYHLKKRVRELETALTARGPGIQDARAKG